VRGLAWEVSKYVVPTLTVYHLWTCPH
jgi:hypothetical protein